MGRRSPSILHRIVLLHLLALAGISVAISAAAYFLLDSTANDFERRVLHNHAQDIAKALSFRDGLWHLDLPADLKNLYNHDYNGYSFAVVDDAGQAIYSSPSGVKPVVRNPGARTGLLRLKRGASTYYELLVPVQKANRTAWIEIGQNLGNPDVIVDDIVALFLGRIAFIVVPIFVVLLLLDVLLMRQSLAPIVTASRVAALITPTHIAARLPLANLPREVLPLAIAVNAALERLEKAMQAQREFTANAAHELRTPLAILRTHVDTLFDGKSAEALRGDIDAMAHIVDQLLELAELEGMPPDWGASLDLNDVGMEAVSGMAPMALAAGKAVELQCGPDPLWIYGNGEMLARAVRNLIENAIRHSPPGGTVEVEIASPAEIHVKDRGPGVPPSDRVMIFQRFWRKNRQDKAHPGLGLAIVAKIVQLHGGAVAVRERQGGGAEFIISLAADAARKKRPPREATAPCLVES